ncbi:MAG TPA: protein kinase [Blastocatellia bacterium]|nr:protein kinase [Blastocatellia bacterium]
MNPERWRQIGQIYHTASESELEARAAFLDGACGGDDELRREVESLLRAREKADGFIAGKAAGMADLVIDMAAEQQTTSLVGRSLAHYQALSLIGAGGMGEVYLAEDTRLGRKVALKLLPAAFTQDLERVRRFKQEARAASSLNHPNILTIHEIGEASTEKGGAHYIVSEFVEGETLRALLRSRPLDIGKATAIAEQIASALSVAHKAGIIHRDIKPENVMARPDGLVKVLDFGLAKLTERQRDGETEGQRDRETESGRDMLPPSLRLSVSPSLRLSVSTTPGMVMGTVSYMSPEQARGQKVDHRTDIFSLGVVLYEMLAGRRPFDGATISDVIAALLSAEPPPLGQHCAEATAEVERIVGKCLAKDPEARYQTGEELIAELKALRSGSQMEGAAAARRIESAGERFALWRWPAVAAIAAMLIVGLVYFLVWRSAPAAQPDQIKSLAVLPLDNLSGDPAQDYFADGITEALIVGLAKVGALRVSSRTSVMQYQRTRKPLADIARELNVDAVVEGTVQRFGEKVKITAQLIHAPTERHLWGETYERDLSDALALQNEIARAVIQQVQIKLTPQEQTRLASARPVNPAAYDDYLRGRYYTNRQIRADNEIAISALERAVAADPGFAAAQAELAQAYIWRLFLFTPGEKQWEEKAFVAVEKALALDPDSAAAHLARGRLLWTPSQRFPHEQAIQEYRRALALDPSLDEARNQLALVYNHIGAFDLALQELQKAVAVNPTNNLAQFRIGETLVFQGKYEQGLTALRKSPKAANPVLLTSVTSTALLHLGRAEEVAATVDAFLKDYPGNTDIGLFTSLQALLAALAGAENKAEGKIRSAIENGKGFGHFHHTSYNIACAYSVMKKVEPAIKWLQVTADDGFPCYPLFERDPFLENLRKDSRFIALIAKLKEQWEHSSRSDARQ